MIHSHLLSVHSYSREKEMTLSDFKFIFYMEWGHRLWGRATGMVFLLPALYFLKKGWISKAMKPRMGIFAGLLAFQVREDCRSDCLKKCGYLHVHYIFSQVATKTHKVLFSNKPFIFYYFTMNIVVYTH